MALSDVLFRAVNEIDEHLDRLQPEPGLRGWMLSVRDQVEALRQHLDAGPQPRGRRLIASEWLIDRFRERREWPSAELIELARAAEVSRDALFEAKEMLGLPKPRRVMDHAAGVGAYWLWWVPADWPHLEVAAS